MVLGRGFAVAGHAAALRAGELCNGHQDLCSLRFSEVTLLGSHNAGAHGFGVPRDCAYSCHSSPETGQLDREVRLLDLDTCMTFTGPAGQDGQLYSCHGRGLISQLQRPISEVLSEVAAWVEQHPREVLLLSFGDNNADEESSRAVVASRIQAAVQTAFGDRGLAARVSDLQAGKWPSLREMLSSGRRVVVMLEGDPSKQRSNLYGALPHAKDFLFNLNDHFHYTYSEANAGGFQPLLDHLEQPCQGNVLEPSRGVHLDAVLKPAVLRAHSDGACACNECAAREINSELSHRDSRGLSLLERAQEFCQDRGFHVHAVKVDYEEFGELQTLLQLMNAKNVKRFCPHCHNHSI